ncbi:N-acetylneuraminate synthase [Ferrimonas marina]|uniref:N-acetylneuraminate synthase n=1 Tax=Ferrimonas marina TaxID=299255 RepID=A0A1M5QV09_9GAMM|nr:N-acetylneuraminate synthase [Ferrimonas marina]SHH17706.1 N-acetylneuraminate synthase [Ferrimonas marina]
MTRIIAEAGVNHNGSAELAFALVDAAHAAGADVVKFQTFKASELVTAEAQQAQYQSRNTGVSESQLAMLSRLELDFPTHKALVAHCEKRGIEFLSTAFDSDSLRFLVGDLGLKTLKLPSGELTNLPFVLEHARTGCDLIVSTGMATLAEVEAALSVIAFGLVTSADSEPSLEAFQQAFVSTEGQRALQQKVTLLHCTTEYPAPMAEINLRAMDTLACAFDLPVGYSDHSAGITVPVAAAARGAVVIEKHFTLDCQMEGPDHKASLEPDALTEMVTAVRAVSLALGSRVKAPTASELPNRPIARKSLVAARAMEVGQRFTTADLCCKRPGTGMSPSHYWALLGQPARRAYRVGELIDE